MQLSISNIAWDIALDPQIATLLDKHQVRFIDVAPGKYFSDFSTVTDDEITDVKNWWRDRGISLCGMQSLLFGTKGLNLFQQDTQPAMLEHLRHVCHIGAMLGTPKLVFGSPKNRDRSGLNDHDTLDIAQDFFNRLGDVAKKEGVIICLEANPACYGTNFLTTTQEAARFVRELNHPNIRLQLDLGTIYTNKEDPEEIIEYADLIGHIHLSEVGMAEIDATDEFHERVAEELNAGATKQWFSTDVAAIEMLTKIAQSPEDCLRIIEHSLDQAKAIYGIGG